MDMMKKTSLAFAMTTLLSACGGSGSGSNNETAADWESYVVPQTAVAPLSVSHSDISVDAYGDLVTLGRATSDADPSTPAFDAKHQIVVAKQDRNGNQIWQSLLEYPGDSYTPYEIESDENGNLYIVGDGFIIATNSNGQLLWQDTFDGLGLSVTVKNGLVYVPAAVTRIYDLNGNLQSTIDNGGIYPWEVVVTDDGSVIQATWNAITRHDASGNPVWSVPAPSDVTTMAKIQIDSSENVYVSYMSNDGSGGGEVVAAMVYKVSANGTFQWERFIPDHRPSSNYYKGGRVHLFLTSTGDVLNITAGTKGRQITKLDDATGQVIWEKVYSGEGEGDDAYLDANDSLIIVGSSNPQRFDANGNLIDTGDMAYTITKNTLAVYGNQYYVGGNVTKDADGNDLKALYTAAFSK